MKKVEVDGNIHLCLFALRDIYPGQEVRYDYWPDTCGSVPWRKISACL